MTQITITTTGLATTVKTPFNKDFVREANFLAGKFCFKNREWTFDSRDESTVRQTLKNIFGTDGANPKMVDVSVTTTREIHKRCDDITFAGRVIASALGRDSGARPGQSVTFINKKPQSGGSMKNWATIIKEGTHFIIKDVYADALHMFENIDGIEYSFEASAQNIAAELSALKEQKAYIEKRIKELTTTTEQA